MPNLQKPESIRPGFLEQLTHINYVEYSLAISPTDEAFAKGAMLFDAVRMAKNNYREANDAYAWTTSTFDTSQTEYKFLKKKGFLSEFENKIYPTGKLAECMMSYFLTTLVAKPDNSDKNVTKAQRKLPEIHL